MPKYVNINEQIRASQVLVIGEKGEQLGVLPMSKALQLARERNLDLVEVAATADPPVCRLLDYGRVRYENIKKEREARKHQKGGLLKEVRIRPKIGEHDMQLKTRMAERFLAEGDKVKVTVVFRGRELAYPQRGQELLTKIMSQLKGSAIIERSPLVEGRNITIILAPSKVSKERKEKVEEAKGS
ncbi:MAG: translation initiation factor IF-3 [Chloroflexi bacterium]|nr:translation initiation factor IF-3 [Chloroflexota bacterium]